MRTNEQGIALVQVLIISLILISLGIFISQTVRSQINITHQMKGAFELRVEVENAKARLLQTLLTNQLYKNVNSENEIARAWNFYGKPFTVFKNVKITIQGLNSLLSLNVMDRTLTRNLLGVLEYSTEQTETFIDSLTDWKDKDDLARINGAERSYYRSQNIEAPRNGYLQSLSEIAFVRGGNVISYEHLHKYFSTAIVSDFNPLNAPEKLLLALIKDESVVNEVVSLRANDQLTQLRFFQLTGIDADQFINFSTGKVLDVTISIDNKDRKISHSFVVEVQPTKTSQPITFTNVSWNN